VLTCKLSPAPAIVIDITMLPTILSFQKWKNCGLSLRVSSAADLKKLLRILAHNQEASRPSRKSHVEEHPENYQWFVPRKVLIKTLLYENSRQEALSGRHDGGQARGANSRSVDMY
jgi:hypothetical protein